MTSYYWTGTSSYSILNDFVNHGRIDASEKFEVLLNGGTITENISEELTYGAPSGACNLAGGNPA